MLFYLDPRCLPFSFLPIALRVLCAGMYIGVLTSCTPLFLKAHTFLELCFSAVHILSLSLSLSLSFFLSVASFMSFAG